MNEASFCTIISHCPQVKTFFKIPDPNSAYASTTKRAFDIIATINFEELTMCCIEAKFLKSLSAFSFKKIEPHQDLYLNAFGQAEGVKSFVVLGVDAGRSDKRAYIFDWNTDFSWLYINDFSIHKKYLELLPYNIISKNAFDFKNIITIDELLRVYGVETKEALCKKN